MLWRTVAPSFVLIHAEQQIEAQVANSRLFYFWNRM
jgi:hypothetical protein